MLSIIEKICLNNRLDTYDPYDIWKTKWGLIIKSGFNKKRDYYLIPAAIFTIFDLFVNNSTRFFYKKQEYPIVRAFAALVLINLYKKNKKQEYIEYAKLHVSWLLGQNSKELNGYGWGLKFDYPVKADVFYDKNAALSTVTPYAMEAIFELYEITKEKKLASSLKQILVFFDKDIKIVEETEEYTITSYGTFRDRAVVNSVSYTMFGLALSSQMLSKNEKERIENKIYKLYNFIVLSQRDDGAWLYDYTDKKSFIDCFHSAFVLKNLIKTSKIIELPNSKDVIDKGFKYIKENFLDKRTGLFKRFSLANKPSPVKYDLYDNAEMLNLLVLLKEHGLAVELNNNIQKYFVVNNNIYSTINLFNRRKNKNMLRWAVLPYLYSLSKLDLNEKD